MVDDHPLQCFDWLITRQSAISMGILGWFTLLKVRSPVIRLLARVQVIVERQVKMKNDVLLVRLLGSNAVVLDGKITDERDHPLTN